MQHKTTLSNGSLYVTCSWSPRLMQSPATTATSTSEDWVVMETPLRSTSYCTGQLSAMS